MFMEHKMTYIERIHDISTGEITEREYTANEIAEVQANIAKETAKAQAEAIKAAEKAALLERLGITADEAALLLS
jgi:hypothetical protein